VFPSWGLRRVEWDTDNGRYFCYPNFKDFIEAIPGTYATEADRKYEGINSGEYLVERLTATY
jgi:hypothetical protein